MTTKFKTSVSVLALGVAMASGSVLAYQEGDIVIRAGIATVAPDEDSSLINVPALGGDVAGTGVEVDDDTQLGLTGLYMLSNNIGLELLAATPFTHTVSAKGLEGYGIDEVADVKHLPPTLSVQYFPMPSDSKFQPYVGVGLNYTIFFDEEASNDVEESVLGDTSVSLDDSFGLAFQLGCDFAITDQLVINAAVWKIDIDTEATLKTAGAGLITVDVDIDPYAYMVGLGYKF